MLFEQEAHFPHIILQNHSYPAYFPILRSKGTNSPNGEFVPRILIVFKLLGIPAHGYQAKESNQ